MATPSPGCDEKCSLRELRESILLRFAAAGSAGLGDARRSVGRDSGTEAMSRTLGRNRTLWHTTAVSILSVAIVNFGFVSAAAGAIVDTEMLVAPARDADLSAVRAQLDREDVRQQMQELGVDAANIDSRLATLSDRELHQLAADLKTAPAGGDVLALIGAVFVVLLILELVGVIDIFKKIPR
jgi:hypothetical protein